MLKLALLMGAVAAAPMQARAQTPPPGYVLSSAAPTLILSPSTAGVSGRFERICNEDPVNFAALLRLVQPGVPAISPAPPGTYILGPHVAGSPPLCETFSAPYFVPATDYVWAWGASGPVSNLTVTVR